MMSKSSVTLAIFTSLFASAATAATTVTSMDFRVVGGESVLELHGDGPLQAQTQSNSQDKQLVIDLNDARLGPSASRRLDTSSFNSKVTLVSPYQVDAKSGTSAARVVVQMREWAEPKVSASGNSLLVRVANDSVTNSAAAAETPRENTPSVNETTDPRGEEIGMAAKPKKGDRVESRSEIQAFLDNREEKHFNGRPITLQVKDAELTDVFRLIGEASGFNIVMGDDVKGKITLSLNDVPWDQALDLILRSQRLGAERNFNVLRIVSLDNMTKERKAELEAQAAATASTPRITRIFPINYARLKDLSDILTKFASASPTSNILSGASLNDSVLIQADERTNSILVRDTPANVDKMRRLIELLDTQTPQVIIEARIVEAGDGFSKSMGGNIGLRNNTSGALQLNQANITSAGLLSDATTASLFGDAAPAGSSGLALTPSIRMLAGVPLNARLNAFLQAQESENKIKIVASPRIVVLNKETANILQSQPVIVTTSVTNPSTNTPTQVQSILQANLSLRVQPSVTNDGSILMDLDVSRDIPVVNTGVGNRNLKTKVLVDSGATLVIGGIYTSSEKNDSSGVPFLRDIPILGFLFSNKSKVVDRNELFVFINPRILNERLAGLGSE